MAAGPDQALDKPPVLLIGASGQIGVFVIPRLLAAGFRVAAVSRKGRPPAYPAFEQVEWVTEQDVLASAGRYRHLVSAGPLELAQKLLSACENLQAAVVFSSSSVETKQASANCAERDQMQAMLSLESGIQSLSKGRGMKLVVFRPTLIYGCGMDTNISRLAAWIRKFGFMLVNGEAAGLRQPVHADDLAAAAVAAICSQHDLPSVMHLCGGETLSYAEMVRRIFPAAGKKARLLHLPQWLFVPLVKLATWVKPGSGINAEMVRRQRQDLVFDDRQARESLGYSPRPFRPQAGDFRLQIGERQA